MSDTPNVSNSLTVRVQFKNDGGMLGRLASEVGRLGGDIGAVDLVSVGDGLMVRDLTVNCRDDEHAAALTAGIDALDGFTLLHASDRTGILLHLGGKIEVVSRAPIRTRGRPLGWSTRLGSHVSAWRSTRAPRMPTG